MKNIHILPTDKPSRLLKTMPKGNLILSKSITSGSNWENQNIYITSDEEIEEGDYYYNERLNQVFQAIRKSGYNTIDREFKIILTIDSDLIKDGVQKIDDEFLEWFVKNPSCEEVEIGEGVRYEDEWIDNEDGGEIFQHQYCSYKIIIPKEENSIEAKQRAKNYMSLKGALDSQYVDFSNPNADKITSASTTTIKEEPKPQTLEEVTKQIQNECHNFTKLVVPNVSYQDATNTFLFMKLAELTLKINKMTAKEPKQGLNLSLLEQKLDKALSNETEESLNTWLKEKRDKQETLEEASQKFAYNYFEMNEINHYKALKQGFVAGAKWQQVKTEIENL